MRRIFFLTTLLMMIFMTTAFAEETTENDEPYVYTSDYFNFTIDCPIKPVAVVQNPWQEPERQGEMLVFVNEGFDIKYAYLIQVNAFDDDKVPDFNKASKKTIDEYFEALKESNSFSSVDLVSISPKNKGVYAITAETIEVYNNETGELEGEFVADRRDIYTFFRSEAGRCISIQLVSVNLDKEFVGTYNHSVRSFKDNTEVSKSDKKKDKKEKKDKKDKKDKKNKDK